MQVYQFSVHSLVLVGKLMLSKNQVLVAAQTTTAGKLMLSKNQVPIGAVGEFSIKQRLKETVQLVPRK